MSRSRGLFDDVHDEKLVCRIFAEVVFNRPVRTVFHYGVPPLLAPHAMAGKRVLAPFGKGNHRTAGFCVGVTDKLDESIAASSLKPLLSVQDDFPLFNANMLKLTQWMSDYYQCGWGQVLEGVVPAAVKNKRGVRWQLLLHAAPLPVVEPITTDLAPRVPPNQSDGDAAEETTERRLSDLTAKQRRAYELLSASARPMEMKELFAAAGCSAEVIRTLIRKGWATMSRERDKRPAPAKSHAFTRRKPLDLSPQQHAAVRAIAAAVGTNKHAQFLLHGVTGSGKTEVYLQSIAAAVSAGKQAVVLVPEISLTPQTIQRFCERFDRVAVLHSRLSDVDRNAFWQRVALGEVDVVVGARSALFAPCPRLGVIVVDEEHESTYKQESTPRYHARTAAAERCRLENAVLVLGSATPSLETWIDALSEKIHLLSLPDRISGRALPPVTLVDMREEFRSAGQFRGLSRTLLHAIEVAVRDGGQVILLLNRRGFSTTIFCPLCGHCCKCRHCDVSLTYHRRINLLLCHQCDEEYQTPEKCAECGAAAIKFSGLGTEKLEEEVRKAFPALRIARMDGDTMKSIALYEKTLTAFREGSLDLLLGTQMIAKGLDFPNVSLVGVVNADTALHLPDFRASERTFQLVAQVAGRTGRAERAGRVVVQTYCPEDRAIACAAKHDFIGFAAGELPNREKHGYPPYGKLARIVVRSTNTEHAEKGAQLIGQRLREFGDGNGQVVLLGPAPAPIEKLQDFYRMHLQVLAPTSEALQRALDVGLEGLKLPGGVEFIIDVEPVGFL